MSNPVIKYDQVENDIMSRLAPIAAANPAITLALLPETQDGYNRTANGPQIWVLVEEEQAVDRVDSGLMYQSTTLTVVTTVQAKKLRGATGVRYLAQLIQNRLLGYRASNFDKLRFVESRHEFDDSVWTLYLVFQADGMVQEVPDEVPEALLRQITYETDNNPQWAVIPDPNIPETVPPYT